METLLSLETLGIVKKDYQNQEFRGKEIEKPNASRLYTMVLPPAMGWFAARMVNFVLDISPYEVDVEWMQEILPARLNASVWQHRKGLYVLRVPRIYRHDAKCRLAQKFWFVGTRNVWARRKRFKVGKGNSVTI